MCVSDVYLNYKTRIILLPRKQFCWVSKPPFLTMHLGYSSSFLMSYIGIGHNGDGQVRCETNWKSVLTETNLLDASLQSKLNETQNVGMYNTRSIVSFSPV